MAELIIRECPGNYAYRTRYNAAKAALTVAFAVDFNTAGERLTRKCSQKYLAIPLSQTDSLNAARQLYKALKDSSATTLNVAGNGIYTLVTQSWDQRRVNQYVFDVLRKVHEYWPLQKVISGGQTGVDIAGIVAAAALGIPAVATLPRGFLQRLENGQDTQRNSNDIRDEILIATSQLEGGEAASLKEIVEGSTSTELFAMASGVAQSVTFTEPHDLYCKPCGRVLRHRRTDGFLELKACDCNWGCCAAAEPRNAPHPVHLAYRPSEQS